MNFSCLIGSEKHNIVAPRKIRTRAYPDPNPLETVDNLESILRKSPKIKLLAIFRSPLRANSVPQNLAALQESYGGGTIKNFTSLRAKNFPPGDSTL